LLKFGLYCFKTEAVWCQEKASSEWNISLTFHVYEIVQDQVSILIAPSTLAVERMEDLLQTEHFRNR